MNLIDSNVIHEVKSSQGDSIALSSFATGSGATLIVKNKVDMNGDPLDEPNTLYIELSNRQLWDLCKATENLVQVHIPE